MKTVVVFLLCLSLFALPMYANTPGTHTTKLSWVNQCVPTTSCTFNVYRGTSVNVCAGVVTPIITGVVSPWFDMSPPTGSVFYNVSAVGPSGESACDGEVTVTVQQITTPPPTGNNAVVQ